VFACVLTLLQRAPSLRKAVQCVCVVYVKLYSVWCVYVVCVYVVSVCGVLHRVACVFACVLTLLQRAPSLREAVQCVCVWCV
jgi:hypothetical protein